MATSRQSQFITPLLHALGPISQLDPASLVSEKKLGSDLSFEFLLPQFVETINAAKKLQTVDFEKIPYGHLSQLNSSFTQILSLLQQIAAFSPTSHGNPLQAREALAQGLEDHWNSIYLIVRTILGNSDVESAKNEMDLILSQVKTSVQLSSDAAESLRAKQTEIDRNLDLFLKEKTETFEKEGAEKLELVNRALDEVRNAAAEAGVSQTSVHFKKEADEHFDSSVKWRNGLILIILLLILFSFFGTELLELTGTKIPDTTTDGVQLAIFLTQKGLIVFCLIFALIWAARNYGAARHNYVVNKHRNNALGSFQAFSTSAADSQTKSAVLIQATQSIFTPQASGYVKSDGENSPSSPIVEILRSTGVSKE